MTTATGAVGPTDPELVGRMLAGDRDALAAVYDRYADRLYDFANSMLRGREDAEDAVADSFVIATERLGQLRDPERLRPWLYSIVRSQCLRRVSARDRVAFGGDDRMADMPDAAPSPEREAERVDVREIVWDAAAGLAPRDRALLDLHLRQGLDGAELGEAMGVSAANAHKMMSRLRVQVERSLGALLIARLGRRDCGELAAILTDWDGRFSPLIRKRVARHVDDCPTCSGRRAAMVSPMAMLAAVPMIAAPMRLRDRVLDDTRLVAFGATHPGGAPGWAGRIRTLGLIATLGLLTAAVIVALPRLLDPGVPAAVDPEVTPPAAVDSYAASTEREAPDPEREPAQAPSGSPTEAAEPGDPESPDAPTEEESPQQDPPPAPAALSLSTRSLDLGTKATTRTVTVTNTGGSPATLTATPDAGWLTVTPTSRALEPGEDVTLTASANRSGLGEGTSTGNISLTWDGGAASIAVSVTEENPPAVGTPSASNTYCDGSSRFTVIRVGASDESGVASVKLTWWGDGGSGSVSMKRSGGVWTGTIGPLHGNGGNAGVRATATDTRGNTASGASASVPFDYCLI